MFLKFQAEADPKFLSPLYPGWWMGPSSSDPLKSEDPV
jgi:hypothetical protein